MGYLQRDHKQAARNWKRFGPSFQYIENEILDGVQPYVYIGLRGYAMIKEYGKKAVPLDTIRDNEDQMDVEDYVPLTQPYQGSSNSAIPNEDTILDSYTPHTMAPKRQRITDDPHEISILSTANRRVSLTDEKVITCGKAKWVKFWTDTRSQLQKLLLPSIHITGGENLTTITGGSGAQTATEYSFFTSTDCKEILALAAQTVTAANAHTLFAVNGTDSQINSGDDDTAGSKTIVPLWQQKHTFYNQGNMKVTLELLEYVCRRDTDETLTTCWDDALHADNASANAAYLTAVGGVGIETSNTAANWTKTTVGAKPFGRQLHYFWRKTAYTKVTLDVGQILEYTVQCDRKAISYSNVRNNVSLEGITKHLFIIAKGQLVSTTDPGSVEYNANTITVSGHTYRHRNDYQVACWNGYKRYEQKRVITYLTTQDGGTAGFYTAAVPDNAQQGANDENDEEHTFDPSGR